MPLKLMYITNNPQIAAIAEKTGIDRVFVDMEYIGKESRQQGMNTVKSHHTVDDVAAVRSVLRETQLLVRINPIHQKTDRWLGTQEEIDRVIAAGADVIMLPMFKTAQEVKTFIGCVAGRAKVLLLAETREAAENIHEISAIPGVDEIHIGLNDLHLSYGKRFMFELLSDGTVEKMCRIIGENGVKYGFGGIARLGYGMLPAENVIAEHYRLGSGMAILSRSFCNADQMTDLGSIDALFTQEMKKIRDYERLVSGFSREQFLENQRQVQACVQRILEELK